MTRSSMSCRVRLLRAMVLRLFRRSTVILTYPASTDEWWYRLKQVDLNGAVHFSEPIQVMAVTSVPDILPDIF